MTSGWEREWEAGLERQGLEVAPAPNEHNVLIHPTQYPEALGTFSQATAISGRLPAPDCERTRKRAEATLREHYPDGCGLRDFWQVWSRELWYVEHGSYAGWEENLRGQLEAQAQEQAMRARMLYEQGEASKGQ